MAPHGKTPEKMIVTTTQVETLEIPEEMDLAPQGETHGVVKDCLTRISEFCSEENSSGEALAKETVDGEVKNLKESLKKEENSYWEAVAEETTDGEIKNLKERLKKVWVPKRKRRLIDGNRDQCKKQKLDNLSGESDSGSQSSSNNSIAFKSLSDSSDSFVYESFSSLKQKKKRKTRKRLKY